MPLLNRFALFVLLGIFITYVNAFFMWSKEGYSFLYWWSENFSGLYRVIFPNYFVMGPPPVLMQAIGLMFSASFNTFAVIVATYVWDSWKKK